MIRRSSDAYSWHFLRIEGLLAFYVATTLSKKRTFIEVKMIFSFISSRCDVDLPFTSFLTVSLIVRRSR
jgi:hypothetical protein